MQDIKNMTSEDIASDVINQMTMEESKLPILQCEGLAYAAMTRVWNSKNYSVKVAKTFGLVLEKFVDVNGFVKLKQVLLVFSTVVEYMTKDSNLAKKALNFFNEFYNDYVIDSTVYVYITDQYLIRKQENKRNENKN